MLHFSLGSIPSEKFVAASLLKLLNINMQTQFSFKYINKNGMKLAPKLNTISQGAREKNMKVFSAENNYFLISIQ